MKSSKVAIFILCVIMLLGFVCQSCTNVSIGDIQIVQNRSRGEVYPPPFGVFASTAQMSCRDWINSAARVTGEVKWKRFEPTAFPGIVCVQADIYPKGGRSYEHAIVQFGFNSKMMHVEIIYVEIDGKPSPISGIDLFLDGGAL